MSYKRKTSFRWFWKNQYGRGLTKKAKAYLSQILLSRREKPKTEPILETQKKLFRGRIRTQLVWNAISDEGKHYNIHIRALVINGKQSVDELRQRIEEFIASNENLDHLPFQEEGFEKENIDDETDAHLQQGKVYIELNVRGRRYLI